MPVNDPEANSYSLGYVLMLNRKWGACVETEEDSQCNEEAAHRVSDTSALKSLTWMYRTSCAATGKEREEGALWTVSVSFLENKDVIRGEQ